MGKKKGAIKGVNHEAGGGKMTSDTPAVCPAGAALARQANRNKKSAMKRGETAKLAVIDKKTTRGQPRVTVAAMKSVIKNTKNKISARKPQEGQKHDGRTPT